MQINNLHFECNTLLTVSVKGNEHITYIAIGFIMYYIEGFIKPNYRNKLNVSIVMWKYVHAL